VLKYVFDILVYPDLLNLNIVLNNLFRTNDYYNIRLKIEEHRLSHRKFTDYCHTMKFYKPSNSPC